MKKKYDVAAYVWPAYTGDEVRSRIFWPEGYGEWQTVKNAKMNSYEKPDSYVWGKLPEWTRQPLWGYVNEADPRVMEMEIQCAHDHGVNVFIYDWYWYDDQPFLENCLNDGFLKARNNHLMNFYIMWANHHANHMWDIRLSNTIPDDIIWSGAADMDKFKKLVDRWINKYFKHPSYYKIEGKPVFMIYTVKHFVEGIGGWENAKAALEYFREETVKAGFPGLHLQAAALNRNIFLKDGRYVPAELGSLYELLEFDSTSQYTMKGPYTMDGDYEGVIKATKEEYDWMDEQGTTYFPHVSLGWDNNPRYINFKSEVTTGATPDKVEIAMRQAKEYVDTHDLPAPLVVINSWNEWTETSYLEPDNVYGYGYLEAVKKVFVDGE